MPKTPKPEPLALEDLGELSHYEEVELVRLRERLIADVDRIHRESAHHAKRIKELNQARSDLQRDLAERARSLRAVKHVIGQRLREMPAANHRNGGRSSLKPVRLSKRVAHDH